MTWINGGIRPDAYGHEFYAHLRALDRSACAHILVQAVPEDERWDAVRDRLTRAAAASAAIDTAIDDIAGEDDSLAVNVVS